MERSPGGDLIDQPPNIVAKTFVRRKFGLIPLWRLQCITMPLTQSGVGLRVFGAMWCCSRPKADSGGKKSCVGIFGLAAKGNFKQLSVRLVGDEMMHIDLVWYFLDEHGQANAGIKLVQWNLLYYFHVIKLLMEEQGPIRGSKLRQWIQPDSWQSSLVL